jgi:glycosyltransferase involved in cell wall biosynthesis
MVYNDIKTLTLTFESLKIQTEKDFEVIIADDGSNSDFVSKLQKLISEANFKVKHIWHEDNGWQKEIVMNKAIVASESDYIIFIDGDCIPHKRFIEEHLKLAKEGQVVAGRRVMLTKEVTESLTPKLIASGRMHNYVWPRILWAGLTGKINQAEAVIRLPLFLRKVIIPKKRTGLLGCNFSLYKKDILAVNGFDERFLYPAVGEDTDLEYRLNRIGIYCTVERHLATVYHIWHKLDHTGEEKNLPLFEENNSNNVSWTPYGIIKEDSKQNV